jgi:transcriptional regulator with XRE-family HTH domain
MIGQNLQYLRKKHSLSQKALSEELNIPRTTLGDYERSKTEPNISMLLKLSDYFNVNLKELLCKDLSLELYTVASSDELKVLAISVDQDNEGNIELVESKAEAGYLDSFQNPEYIKDLPKIKFPNLTSGTYRGFEISGDSMLPIESGSIIICSYVENINDIKDNKTYVIISKSQGLVYKRVRFDLNKKHLVLISDNEIYSPYKLDFEEIDEIWQYYAHLSFNDSAQSEYNKLESQILEVQKKLSDLHKRYVGQ